MKPMSNSRRVDVFALRFIGTCYSISLNYRSTGSDPMQAPEKTIDHGTLRRLVKAGARVGAEVIGAAGGWSVVIN